MFKNSNGTEYKEIRKELLPLSIVDCNCVSDTEKLLLKRPSCLSFDIEKSVVFNGKGAYVVLDFGKEICGSLRILTRACPRPVNLHITLGESLSETLSALGEYNSENDHSIRDFNASVSTLSDFNFGQSGFRFAKIELTDDAQIYIQNIYAIAIEPYFDKEIVIKTNDELINKIIETAVYTMKVNCQNGYIWDGIKRDRLVWCGDLNPEILTSVYSFGDIENIKNSLDILAADTPADKWINGIPSYSLWWVVNLCDYVKLSGNTDYFENNKAYAFDILKHVNSCIDSEGNMNFGEKVPLAFFLDWPTFETPDAIIGTAAIICYAVNKLLQFESSELCNEVLQKLCGYLNKPVLSKQVRAMQVLAGGDDSGAVSFIEKGGAAGFSTFMAYYILTAYKLSGGKEILVLIKEYYGGMLSCGATTFWEDFDIEWLKNACSIEKMPQGDQVDVHKSYGKYCYKNFRHSLCHGWSTGVLAFFVEKVLGLNLDLCNNEITVKPDLMGLTELYAEIPVKNGSLIIDVKNGLVNITPNNLPNIKIS